MEEVDKIILHSLRQIGCDIEDGITSLKQFDTDMVVKAAVSCLRLIQPGISLPMVLPNNMAARYRLGQDMAQACIDNGYPGEIGYQTFLYSGEGDVRRVLIFLTEKLPKEQEKFVHQPTGAELVLQRIKCKVKEELKKPWLPFGILSGAQVTHSFVSSTNQNHDSQTAWNEFWSKDLPFERISAKHLLPTIVTLHSRGVLAEKEPRWSELNSADEVSKQTISGSDNKFSQEPLPVKRKPPLAPKPKLKDSSAELSTAVPVEVSAEEELKQEETRLTEEVESLLHNIHELRFKKMQLGQEIDKEEKKLKVRREKDALKARIIQLLDDGDSNVAKLQQIVEGSAHRLVTLATQWEKHRVPLIEKYRELTRVHCSRMNERVKKAETAKSLSERRKELELELASKDKMLVQLQEEYEKNGKEVNRSAYTRRILEIISNIDKQKLEMERVLRDTREIQKEINTLSGQLDRSFTVADETIFRDAKKDEASRRAYKLLATLHSDCDQLVAMVQDTGAIVREIRDLEEQVEKEKAKNIGANLERITADLNQMIVESAQLSAQLKLKNKTSTTGSVQAS